MTGSLFPWSPPQPWHPPMAAPPRVEVSPDAVANAARNFSIGQRDIVDTWMRLQVRLDANGGMAGNDEAAHTFSEKYAPAVQAAWKAFRQSVVVLGGTSLGLTQTANNHLNTDHHSRADGGSGSSGLLGPNEVYPDMSMAAPASVIGPAATGPYFGANKLLATLLAGYWPAAYPNDLQSAAGAWRAASGEIGNVAGWLDWTIWQLADTTKARDFAAIRRYWSKVYGRGDRHSLLGGLAALCNALGDACDGFANATWSTQNRVNLFVSMQEVLLVASLGTETVLARLTPTLAGIAEEGVVAVEQATGRAITAEMVAELEAATAGTPKIEPIEAEFGTTMGAALEDEMTATSGVGPRQDAANGALPTAEQAEQMIRSADRIGSGLKADTYHRAESFPVDEISTNGRIFSITGGDGASRILVQLPGELNGVSGRFEWMLDGGRITHQMFVRNGRINGIPIRP